MAGRLSATLFRLTAAIPLYIDGRMIGEEAWVRALYRDYVTDGTNDVIIHDTRGLY